MEKSASLPKITTVAEYFERLPEPAHACLSRLREQLQNLLPEAAESIHYQIPILRFRGRPLIGFGAATKHGSIYVMSTDAMLQLKPYLVGMDYSGITIRFPFSETLSDELLKKILAVRIEENDLRDAARAKKKRKV